MLESRLGQARVASPTQARATNGLRVGPFDASSSSVALTEFIGSLPTTGSLERLEVLAGL
jgi:hypothetical protein